MRTAGQRIGPREDFEFLPEEVLRLAGQFAIAEYRDWKWPTLQEVNEAINNLPDTCKGDYQRVSNSIHLL